MKLRPLLPALALVLLAPPSPVSASDLAPDALELHGRVFLGEVPQVAQLEFLVADGSKIEAATNESGSYRLLAGGPLRKVAIELPGREGKPFHEFFFDTITQSGQRDFHLPATELRVKIRDAVSGRPIPGAVLRLRNSFPARDKKGQLVAPRRPGEIPTNTVAQTVVADRDGVATAFYLQPGQAEFSATAGSYLDSGEPLKVPLAENEHVSREILLQPLGEKAGLVIRLPGGEPAAGARAMLVASLETFEALEVATADHAGRLELPRNLAGAILAIRHPGAAFLLGRWQPAEAPDEAQVQLEPATEKPLSFRAQVGGRALGYAEVVIWAGGRRLQSHALFQLTGARPLTDGEGLWSGGSLPQGPVKVLVFGRQDTAKADAIRAGQLDAHAVEIPYPWPELVEIEGLD